MPKVISNPFYASEIKEKINKKDKKKIAKRRKLKKEEGYILWNAQDNEDLFDENHKAKIKSNMKSGIIDSLKKNKNTNKLSLNTQKSKKTPKQVEIIKNKNTKKEQKSIEKESKKDFVLWNGIEPVYISLNDNTRLSKECKNKKPGDKFEFLNKKYVIVGINNEELLNQLIDERKLKLEERAKRRTELREKNKEKISKKKAQKEEKIKQIKNKLKDDGKRATQNNIKKELKRQKAEAKKAEKQIQLKIIDFDINNYEEKGYKKYSGENLQSFITHYSYEGNVIINIEDNKYYESELNEQLLKYLIYNFKSIKAIYFVKGKKRKKAMNAELEDYFKKCRKIEKIKNKKKQQEENEKRRKKYGKFHNPTLSVGLTDKKTKKKEVSKQGRKVVYFDKNVNYSPSKKDPFAKNYRNIVKNDN